VVRKLGAPYYERAGYLYRRLKNHGVKPEETAREMGLAASEVKRLIRVYSFMVDHKDNDPTRWSHYDEYLKPHAIKRAKKIFSNLDEVIVRKIKSGEILKAVDVRGKLAKIAKAGDKILRDFVEGEKDFESSYERAIARGAGNEWLSRLHKFRTVIAEPDTADNICEMPKAHRVKCVFELNKIRVAAQTILTRLEKVNRD
jgi:hypothetical protein